MECVWHGFFPACQDDGESSTIHSPPWSFLLMLLMMLSVSLFLFLIIIILLDISSSAPISFFHSKNQSTVAKWQSELRRSGTSVPWRVACEVLSLMGSNTVPGQNNVIVVSSNATSVGRGIRMNACLAGTCHLHFWQNDPRGLLRARAVARGWNGYRK